MGLYPKISDTSILLDNDCKRMLKRNSRKLIICEVLEKISDSEKKQTIFIANLGHGSNNNNDNNNDITTTNNTSNTSNTSYTSNTDTIDNNRKNNNNLYEFILDIFGCNIKYL
tara:strand:+ start:435 stop:773 length:339 start_codon:yes stop_codon:yes gene_type:complete